MVNIIVIPNHNFIETNKDLISNTFKYLKLEPLDSYQHVKFAIDFNMYYTTDLNYAINKCNGILNNCYINLFSGKYDLSIKNNIEIDYLYIKGISFPKENSLISSSNDNDKPIINIIDKFFIKTKKISFKNITFNYSNSNSEYGFVALNINTDIFRLSKSIINGDSYNNSFLCLDKKYTEIIKINKNIFNNSKLELLYGIWLIIKSNTFNNCNLDSRLSNAFINKNKFSINCKIYFFNQFKSTIYDNTFDDLDLQKTYIIYADHNSNIEIINNIFKIKNNQILIDVFRGSKVNLHNNIICTNHLASVDFNGKLIIKNNKFADNKIYSFKGNSFDQIIIYEDDSYDLFSNKVEFLEIKK